MTYRTLAAIGLAAILLAGRANAAERPLSRTELKKFAGSIVRYLSLKYAGDADEKRAEIVKELEDFRGRSWKGLRDALKPPGARPFLRAGKTGVQNLRYPPAGLEEAEFLIDLPRGYSPARPWPLVFLLHGGGMNEGSGGQIQGLMGPAWQKRQCIVIAPTCPPNLYWHSPLTETFLLCILDETAAAYSVDFDRIYVAGHSFGGVGSWSYGTRFPDLFAGFGPAAGNPPNVMDYDLFHNTALYVVHGENDTRVVPDGDLAARDAMEALDPKPRFFVFDFFQAGDAIGHGFPHAKIEAQARFLTGHTRDMYPKRCVCTSPFAQVREGVRSEYHCFWLGVDEHVFKGKAVGELLGDNRIRIRTESVNRVSVYVSDDFLDLDRPVVIELNGRTVFDKLVDRSAAFLLKHVEETHDRGRVFANRIRLP